MVSVLLASGGEVVPTMNTDWKNATKEYMKFQKMNPIFGESYKMFGRVSHSNLTSNFFIIFRCE